MKNPLHRNSPWHSNLKHIGALTLSAALLPFSVFAECGPYGEGQCGECGPHWSDWYAEQCPTNSNTASVTPSWYGCNEMGQSVPQPTVVPPTFAGGRKARVAWYDCSTNLNYQYGGITFSVGAVQWDPPLPGTFGVQHVPSFSSWAYVDVTSSDPNLCPSPGRWYIGSCTWNVCRPQQVVGTVGPSLYTPDWATMVSKIAQILAGLSISIDASGSVLMSHLEDTRQYCCPDGSIGDFNLVRDTGNFSGNLGGSVDFSGVNLFPSWLQNVLGVAQAAGADGGVLAAISGLASFSFGNSASGSGNKKSTTAFQDACIGCYDPPFMTKSEALSITVNDEVNSSLFNVHISINGYFNATDNQYLIGDTIYSKTQVYYYLASSAQVGSWDSSSTVWFPAGAQTIGPNIVQQPICTGPLYY